MDNQTPYKPDESAQPTTDTAPPTSNPTTGMPLTQKKSKKPLIISLIVILLVACIGAAVYYLLLLDKQDSPATSNSQSSNTTPKPVALNAKSLVDEVKDRLKGKIVTADNTDSNGGTTKDRTWVYSLATYTVDGKKYMNLPLEGYGIASKGDKATASSDFAAITSHLKSRGLTAPDQSKDDPSDAAANGIVYTSESIVCYAVQSEYGSEQASLGCADMKSYKDASVKIDPFYTAYLASQPFSTENIVFGAPKISDGVDGHKRAEVYQGNFAGLYYQEPSKDWMFFKATQNQLTCTQYNTVALKKSFSGQTCWNETTQKESTVSA